MEKISLNAPVSVLLLVTLLALAFFVFARVKSDYLAHGALSRPIAILQVGYFFLYVLSSYIFLDSRLSHIQTIGMQFPLAVVLMVIGFLMVGKPAPA